MKTFTRILVLLAGIAMVCLGIWFVAHPGISLLSFTLFIGTLMLMLGIFQIIQYFSNRSGQKVSGWILAEGILSVLLGITLLADQLEGTVTLVIVFGMWVLFAGIMRTIGAFDAKNEGVEGWGWLLTLGILGIILGFISLFNPIVGAIGIVILVGTFFIVQGINCFALFFFIGKLK
ncbi:HdeD family acid-resistance protein [Paenilisteria rocourtiae]|uniref:Uncharacterized membrane protein HdeD (DUF308 family) n=1 Tax=Listeria rocourtiae TaxID=647910 RepID=A0A4R6ZT25_9LIST|nr:HdeD family acid-resistance protein [Listeria rocourtiae]EUJ47239.1 hypothetical protein PROCOU_10466 [Listeria rocourtiae FSL F6-920]MBC1605734.1 HdeD family acid-resistance protein [Listeria rocourtiae]TDR55785.1 uncharacterized membrane protein HdeD (DUF308 family) [Listeria rocourtiae]